MASRGGFLELAPDDSLASRLTREFSLEKTQETDPRWVLAARAAGFHEKAVSIWGQSGRPAQFRLQNGSQLEHFYLVLTTTGRMYLVAEYAYG
jgi:hypothetical protein